MPTVRLTLPTPHKAQNQVILNPARYAVLACGRRFGKSTLGINRLVDKALRGKPVAWFCPSYKMLSDSFRETVTTLYPVITRLNQQEKRIEIMGGGVIDFWSLDNFDAPRGRKYARVVIDEAASVAHLQEAWQAVIRPTLSDYEGDAFFLSTPKGANFFKTVFDWGNDPLRPDWKSWQLPTLSNPHIKPTEIEAARLELPERVFEQEYLARFMESAGGVFRNVRGCVSITPLLTDTAAAMPQPTPGHTYYAGLDWAMTNDFTVMVVYDSDTKEVVSVDRFNQIGWEVQRTRVKTLYSRWGVTALLAEANSIGSPNIEALQSEGLNVIPFQTTTMSKPPLIESLALAFERGEIRIPNDPVLISELEAYERDVSSVTGRPRYSAPEGMHDDTVIALALALQVSINRPRLSQLDPVLTDLLDSFTGW